MRQLPRRGPQEPQAAAADQGPGGALRALRRGERQPLEEQGGARGDGPRREEGLAVLSRADLDRGARRRGELGFGSWGVGWGGRGRERGGPSKKKRVSSKSEGDRTCSTILKFSRSLPPSPPFCLPLRSVSGTRARSGCSRGGWSRRDRRDLAAAAAEVFLDPGAPPLLVRRC